MKYFHEIEGVEDFVKSYQTYERKFMAEGVDYAKRWTEYVTTFLKLNLPKTKFTSRMKIATVNHAISFTEIEKFVESLDKFKVEEVVFDRVSNTFTFYGSKK